MKLTSLVLWKLHTLQCQLSRMSHHTSFVLPCTSRMTSFSFRNCNFRIKNFDRLKHRDSRLWWIRFLDLWHSSFVWINQIPLNCRPFLNWGFSIPIFAWLFKHRAARNPFGPKNQIRIMCLKRSNSELSKNKLERDSFETIWANSSGGFGEPQTFLWNRVFLVSSLSIFSFILFHLVSSHLVSSSLSLFCLSLYPCFVVVVVVCACNVVWHAENNRVNIQNVPVCTGRHHHTRMAFCGVGCDTPTPTPPQKRTNAQTHNQHRTQNTQSVIANSGYLNLPT